VFDADAVIDLTRRCGAQIPAFTLMVTEMGNCIGACSYRLSFEGIELGKL
jgi:hypothetical protein